MAAPCPTPERLAAVLHSRQPGGGDADLAAHLADCPACQQRLEALAGAVDFAFKQGTRAAPSPLLEEAMANLEERPENPAKTPDPLVASGTKLRYFGDYEILEEVGRGGMGVVYRARQVSLNRFVALKLILTGQLASESEVRRFHTEAEAAAKLDHPNIVPIYEISEHEGRHYFSMKLVEGGSLAERSSELRLPDSGSAAPMSNAELKTRFAKLARLMAQIGRAVHYAHQRGVLHRDLKPSNILLDAQGQPHLTDFGLAKMLESDSGLTHSGAIMGTPNYLAPEVAAGKAKEVTTAADVFSLGAILYELLTGRPPFREETIAATLQKVLNAEPASLRSLNPAVPRDLETICLKCLEKEPERRYRGAELLADELDRFVRGEPILARPSRSLERVVKWTRRKPALAGSLAALALVFVLGFTGVLWKWRGEVHQRRVAQQENQRAQTALTRLEIERAESLLEAGDSGQGLAYLARLLRQQPTNRVVAERLMNALSYRSFCLPAAALRHGKALDPLAVKQKQGLPETFAFRRSGSVVMVDFSPNGQRVITASKDGTARLWDVLSEKSVGEPLKHEAEVVWARFSENGQKVVTASVDGSAKIWAANTCQLAVPPLRHEDVVYFAAFSPDGQKVVTASRDKTARIWNAQTGQSIGAPLLHQEGVYFGCFSPDGKFILTADEGNRAHLWESASGWSIATVDHFYSKGWPMPFPQFNPASEQLATRFGYHAFLRDAHSNWAEVMRLAHESYVVGTLYSPDGRRLATVSLDSKVRIWNADTGEALIPPLRHGHWVDCADFRQDAQGIVTASGDNSAKIWDPRAGRMLAEPLRHDREVRWVKFHRNGQRIATISESDSAWLWDVRILQPLVVLRHLPTAARAARFSPNGRHLVVIDEAEEARVWDARSGSFQTKAIHHQDHRSIRYAQFTPDNRRWVTASQDYTAQAWDTATGEPVGRPLRHGDMVNRVDFSADGKRIVTASSDHTARVWDKESGSQLLELHHPGQVTDARYSPDGKLVVTACKAGIARIWDAVTGRPLSQPLQHADAVSWAAFDPAGQRVATGSKDKTARIWSVQTGEMLTPPLLHTDALHPLHSSGFSPDGSRLATVAGSTVQVWDPLTGHAVTRPLRHNGTVHTAQFSPDGRKLLTASEDGTARLWDPETGHPVSEPMRHGSRVTSAEFSRDGTRVVTCSSDKAVRIWEVIQAPLPAPNWLPDLAEAVAGQHIDAQDVSEVLSVEALYQLRQTLVTNTALDYYGRWARWFFADSANRTISPSSLVTVPEYLNRRIEENTLESLEEATRLCATNALAFARLAEKLVGTNQTVRAETLKDADWFSRYATNLAPRDPEILQVRASVVKSLSRTNGAEGTTRLP